MKIFVAIERASHHGGCINGYINGNDAGQKTGEKQEL